MSSATADEQDDSGPPDPLGRLLEDLRDKGKPSRTWLDAHARDGRFRDVWLAVSDPLDVWRVVNYAPTLERYVRLAAVSAAMVAPVLGRFPQIRAAARVVAGWLNGDELTPEPLGAAKDVLVEESAAQKLALAEMCAASAFISLIGMLLDHQASSLSLERASSEALLVVEHVIDALAVERRESVFRDLSEIGVDKAQAERVSQLAFACAEEARGAELAARLAAAIECPRVDELGASA